MNICVWCDGETGVELVPGIGVLCRECRVEFGLEPPRRKRLDNESSEE